MRVYIFIIITMLFSLQAIIRSELSKEKLSHSDPLL